MPLQLIAVPIGNPGDITFRAIEALKAADLVVGEERKEVSKLLKLLGIEGKEMELLNEHSRDDDVKDLLKRCKSQTVALVSDCGTPGFCDPGARLVAACREANVKVTPLPGASSLMCILAVTGVDMRQFLFRGFLPVDKDERYQALRDLDRERRPVVLMDTPYRLNRLLDELCKRWPNRRAVIGLDFTQSTEDIYEGELSELVAKIGEERKAEFILVLHPAVGVAAGPGAPAAAAPARLDRSARPPGAAKDGPGSTPKRRVKPPAPRRRR